MSIKLINKVKVDDLPHPKVGHYYLTFDDQVFVVCAGAEVFILREYPIILMLYDVEEHVIAEVNVFFELKPKAKKRPITRLRPYSAYLTHNNELVITEYTYERLIIFPKNRKKPVIKDYTEDIAWLNIDCEVDLRIIVTKKE